MTRYRLSWVVVIFVGVMVCSAGWGWTQHRDPQADLDALNAQPAWREHHTWGIFLGTGWSPSKLGQIEQWQREGKWMNPFTGQPFADAKVFVFGHDHPALEGFRIASDHLDVHVLSSWEELKGQHFDFVICHSNGCTNALGAHQQGLVRAEHFYALGTDWTSKSFEPGALHGADLTFFAMATDPIWKLPAPNWARITEDTPGFKFSVPFDRPTDIMHGLRHLLTQGRADPDRFPVIRLEPPSERRGELFKPFQAHALVDSYFQVLGQWMQGQGSQQHALTEQLRRRDDDTLSDDLHPGGLTPPGCPPMCGGGPGGPGGPDSGGVSPGHGIMPEILSPDPRGGISVDIRLTPQDFQSR